MRDHGLPVRRNTHQKERVAVNVAVLRQGELAVVQVDSAAIAERRVVLHGELSEGRADAVDVDGAAVLLGVVVGEGHIRESNSG